MFNTASKLAAVSIVLAIAGLAMTGGAFAGNSTAGNGKLASPNQSKIPTGGCCSRVNNQCISWCNKTSGCTGNSDCDVKKAR